MGICPTIPHGSVGLGSMHPRTSTLVAAAGLVLLACGLLVFDWMYLVTWALSGGSYPGPLYAVELPLTLAAIACAVAGKRMGQAHARHAIPVHSPRAAAIAAASSQRVAPRCRRDLAGWPTRTASPCA